VPWDKPNFEIRTDNTAIVVVDFQNDFLVEGAPYESVPGREMIDDVNGLLRVAREAGIPVMFTAHSHRADGSDLGAVAHLHPLTAEGKAMKEGSAGVELYPKLDVQSDDYVIHKRRFSGFYATDLELLLRNLGVEVLVIAGVATNVCCESTARDAFFRDFKVVFLADGNGTFDHPDVGFGQFSAEEVQAHTLTNITMYFGEVATIDEVKERITAARAAADAS
jgi:ureidoacrylate peracid hydrolase